MMKLIITDPWEIGPRLRKVRNDKCITLREMVKITDGISATTIAKVETGNNLPAIGTLIPWAKALGYDEITIKMEDPEA